MLLEGLLILICAVVLYHLLTWAISQIRVSDYTSKHVFITGCDSGFGSLLTKRLDGLGFNVFAACLTSKGAEALQGVCSSRVTTLLLDVTDGSSIETALQFVKSRLPAGLWAIVNNAGVAGPVAPVEWLTRKDWDCVLGVNLMGMIEVTRAFLPLVRLARGRVVNIASIMGRIAAVPGPYSVSKFGVEAFSDCLRREVAKQGIKVCILEPGFFLTDIIDASTSVKSFTRVYDATTNDIRRHYTSWNHDQIVAIFEKVQKHSSKDLNVVVNAYELALTSKFPPTRQVLGYDARFIFRLLWNLPTPLCDWILAKGRNE